MSPDKMKRIAELENDPDIIEMAEGQEAAQVPMEIEQLSVQFKALQISVKSMEMVLLKSMVELNTVVRENFIKQDNANRMLADATDKLTEVIEKSFKEVLDAAVSRDHVPARIANKMISTMAIMLLAVTAALIFSLTGIQSKWLPNFHALPDQVEMNRQYMEEVKRAIEAQTNVKLPPAPDSPLENKK